MLAPIVGGFLTVVLVGGAVYWYSHQAQSPLPVETPIAHPTGGSTLLAAVASGNVDDVKSLLAKGANVDAADQDGTTPLMLASESSANIVEALLADGAAHVASVDALGRSGIISRVGGGKRWM